MGARAEEIPRGEYLRLLPLARPRLVQQTEASAALHLFGDRADPAYRDVDPVDGIDDRRHAILLALALRFAPLLVQNTSEFPTNLHAYAENADSFPLQIDTWDVSGVVPELLGTRAVDFAALGAAACTDPHPAGVVEAHPHATSDAAVEDCKLLELLERVGPGGSADDGDPAVRPRRALVEVMFFDFPGDGPETWSEGYEPEYRKSSESLRRSFPHAFVHPFLQAVSDEAGTRTGYELVFQYWFFYPSNDSGMNHEGDWEHLNVVIAPRSGIEGPLSEETVRRILAGELPPGDDAGDPLVIRRLDYYFHHSVMTLDFTRPNVYLPREEWKEEVRRLPKTRFQESEIWLNIRHLAWVDDDETIPNTHPLGYIGADNKGLDQLLAAPGGKNRNPHGTFPFPGRYSDVGPGGTTDQVSVYVDPRKHRRKLAAGEATIGPEFHRGAALGLADPDRLTIVPDWERVTEAVRADARARRDWSWLVLPIRWGYPATRSPFAGIVEHFDTGNVAVLGPAFNGGWNASGPAPGFFVYEPHALPSVFPLGPQDSFRNDLGFLNAPLILLNLPPLDFAARIAAYPLQLALGRRDPVYYPKEGVPFRFVGVSSGVSIQRLDQDLSALALNADQFEEFILRLVSHIATNGADSTTVATSVNEFRDHPIAPFLQIPFYIGGRVASENTVRNVRPSFGLNVEFTNVPPYRYSAELNLWEYAGSVRYSLTTSRLQPFVKGGYGWIWYRVENAQANGVPFVPATSAWVKPERIWPNVWHFGAGVEYVPWKRSGTWFRGAEVALRAEWARYIHDLGLDLSRVPIDELGLIFDTVADVPSGNVTRDDFLLGLTLSF